MKDALALLFGIGIVALGVWFYAGDIIAAKTGLPISRSNIEDKVDSFNETTAEAINQMDTNQSLLDIEFSKTSFKGTQTEVANQPDPSQRHLDLKQHMLELTNQKRSESGIPPVRLGTNPAAQLHAEAAMEGCYSAHWDRWGLKPSHRYTITGGTGAEGENVSGLDYCIKAQDNYRANEAMNDEVNETVQGWMGSPGHRRNLLDPAHTVLNVGIAHDKYNTVMVQHFSTDYVTYQVKPFIDSTGILRLEATSDRATFNIGNSVSIQIYYDPPPKLLTRGQISHTYALCNGKKVASVIEPLTGGWSYSDPAVKLDTQKHSCIDPYHTDPNRPAPDSPREANQAWANAKAQSAAAPPITTKEIRIIADRLDKSTNHINVEADINQILRENGPGIYTIMLWGRPAHMSESTPLSEQSIFWQTQPPPGNPYIHHRQIEQVRAVEASPTAEPTKVPEVMQQTQPWDPAPTAVPLRITAQVPTPNPEITIAERYPEITAQQAVRLNTPYPTAWLIPQSPPRTGIILHAPTPRPHQLIGSTQAPAAIQIPTPTATPLPTKQTYTSQALRYSIDHPYGWTVRNEGPETLIQGTQGMGGFIKIERYPVQKDQSLGDLADAHTQKLLLQAPQWTEFNSSFAGSATNNSGRYLTLEFARKKPRATAPRQDGRISSGRSTFPRNWSDTQSPWPPATGSAADHR